ncbi:uncharacterized protein LOC144702593 [Wolffia australiana]
MACMNMFNQDYQGMTGPRISFSNDFGADTVKYERAPPAGGSPDFSFAVERHGMIAADEVFFMGRLMPLKEQARMAHLRRTTLREELSAAGAVDLSTAAPPRAASKMGLRWKALMGLRRGKQEKKREEEACEDE